MKMIFNNSHASATVATILVLIVSVAHPVFANSTEVLGLWKFKQTSGPIIDEIGNKNGTISYSDQNYQGEAVRASNRIAFEGKPNSIVFINDDNDNLFNATSDITYFRYKARFKLPYDIFTSVNDAGEKTFPSNATWNVMQKGRSANEGGQWKMQIREKGGKAYLQCVVRDSPFFQIEATAWDLPIKPNKVHYATCVVDRQQNLLKVILENEQDNGPVIRSNSAETATNSNGVFLVPEKRGIIPEFFGDISPIAGECNTSSAFGQNVTIGNKPVCEGEINNLNSSDQFVGKIYQVKIERQ